MKAKRNAGENTLIATLELSLGRELRIELSRFKGANFVATRVWAKKELGGRLMPVSNQGLNFPVELIPTFVSSLQQLAQVVFTEESQGDLDFSKAANEDYFNDS